MLRVGMGKSKCSRARIEARNKIAASTSTKTPNVGGVTWLLYNTNNHGTSLFTLLLVSHFALPARYKTPIPPSMDKF